jgi:hypothetical protein
VRVVDADAEFLVQLAAQAVKWCLARVGLAARQVEDPALRTC